MKPKMFIADVTMSATSVLLFVLFVYVTVKVVRIIQFTDKVIMFMLIFLDLTLVGKLLSYTMS